jgi:hypothetical protein
VTAADLMAQLAQEWAALEPQPNEFTATQFAERTGKDRKAADYFLVAQWRAKKLSRRLGLVDGKKCWLYSDADKVSGI